MIISVR